MEKTSKENKKESKSEDKKGFFVRLFGKMDKNLKQKAEKKSCCCCCDDDCK
jgi:hypothetical protein